MFQYDYEKRPTSVACDSRTATRDFYARRPLPPRPECDTLPAKPSVPLKVWIIASASCFAVCAVLVLATVVVIRWTTTETYTARDIYAEAPEPIFSFPYPQQRPDKTTTESESQDIDNEIQYPILEKLSIFKNIVANRDRQINLASKPQIHPLHDTSFHHPDKKIEKKDKPKPPIDNKDARIPEFKPTLPDIFTDKQIKLSDGYVTDFKHNDYDDYYNDENLYDDYMQSNTMTSYLIEKVQELHEWITSDPTFEVSKQKNSNNFGQVLKALNESLIEGNVTIIMSKLRDIYFGDNYTVANSGRKIILTNSTNLLSFGILTMDVMLLHNIQLMAWENQEGARNKMLKDPDVFAFNALFMEPSKVESKRKEVYHHYENSAFTKRQNFHQEPADEFSMGKNLLENVLELGMSTARAAIHLGKAYKNTKNLLNQLSNREAINANIQNQLSRNIDGNTHALHHLQTSYNDSASVASESEVYTDLDCVWLLYCKNLVATAKLNPPYGTMARINGLALRMLAGDLAADRALDTMLYEALTGWSELRCNDMFPKCSKVNAAAIVLDSIIQPLKKSQKTST
ncbi:uncharacterized protein LOC119838557 [Zerene cesonia]|uniref:uncharacterized protein LOC119838557 n=1 Tax=Zerene cesonia TaxID=33412 RepID=UPI0018E4FA55|nr:uncharacterized protein LOC119838557 [Zerene cesonia]XP_038220469.1 uncharacterized protein LOC119838557 [Zerene cesonia]